MCTVCMERNLAKPQFALFNYVFSSDADKDITVESVKKSLDDMGVNISYKQIEDSFGKWRRTGMLHKVENGFRLGPY